MTDKASLRNAIWILTDQQPAYSLSCNGDPNITTPNLDRLAAGGINFNRAVSGFPLCCPFRGSMLSSRWPHECVPGHEYQMDPALPTVATAFNEQGFDTAYFGKWHVDGWHERDGRSAFHIVPPERRGGFKTWVGYDNNNSQWDSWVHGGEGSGAFHYRLPGYETDCLTDLLIEFIRKKGKEKRDAGNAPFFAVLSVQPPHDPYLAPAEYMAKYNPQSLRLRPDVPPIDRIQETARRELAGMYAMIHNMDDNIGRVRRALAEEDLEFDTNIIFFSDHGDMHGSHGQFKKTAPWEESIRIPMIAGGLRERYGGRSGRRSELINHVDIAPTTLGLCGLDVPDWMRGTDYSGYRLGDKPEPTAPDSTFIQLVIPTMHGDSVDRPWRGVVTADGWKYVCLEHQPWMLFNLNEDPFELANHAHNTKYGAIRRKLNDRLAQWIADTGDTFSLPDV